MGGGGMGTVRRWPLSMQPESLTTSVAADASAVTRTIRTEEIKNSGIRGGFF
jgi:hypothetical protein